MNDRQRFNAAMHYQPRDRVPLVDFGFWPETIVGWYEQGLPRTVLYPNYDGRNTDVYFGMDRYTGGPGVNVGLVPAFEWKVLEDRGDHEVAQQADGVRVLRKKFMGSIPHHESHLLVDRASWREHYLPRLNPSDPARYPKDFDAAVKVWCDPDRADVCSLWCGSLFGWLRDWMGLENIALVPYDDPAWFEEMVTTLADCIMGVLEKVLATGGRFDSAAFWEDMCFNSGPLLSPAHFKQYLVPHYRRITDLLRRHAVDVVWVDCDGKIDALLPLWLESGVNCMFPMEVGTWGADPLKYRREFGRDLLMMGGVDKHILAKDHQSIEAEVRRLAPLVEAGGYIPMPDHRVPPDVPFDNYRFYIEKIREVWAHNINLKPIGWETGTQLVNN